MKIIIIQNTHYHFETLISIYQIIKNMGYDPYIYKIKPDKFEQNKFYEKYHMSYADNKTISEAICGIVISAYPNPLVDKKNSIPNHDDPIFSILKNRIIYISHRFKNQNDYIDSIMNKYNTVCLSSLSNKIGIDHINLVTSPIKPNNTTFMYNRCRITIQCHFNLNNRNKDIINDIINNAVIYNYHVNLLGTSSIKYFKHLLNKNTYIFDGMNELNFYNVLNNYTDWIFSGIDESTNKKTYIEERYSSNFNQAFITEKPIISHKIFQSIYKIPGVYYFDINNILNIIQYIKKFTTQQYTTIINNFAQTKINLLFHTKNILQTKINYVCNL